MAAVDLLSGQRRAEREEPRELLLVVNFAVNYVDPNYPVVFAENYSGLVLGKGYDGVDRCSSRQSSR